MSRLFNRKILLTIGSLVVVAAIGAVLFQKPIMTAFMPEVVRSVMSRKNVHFADGLYAGLCGSGSPMPDANRAGPCVAVLAGSHLFIVDAGEGSTKNVLLMKFPIGKADAILLTHFHSDHIADLGEMELQRWVGGSNKTPIDVIGPSGVERVVGGFNIAYQLDVGYRVAHHGPEIVPPTGAGGIARPFRLSDDPRASVVVLDRDGVRITAFKVDHRPVAPAVGYRFDYKNRSVVVSGDTVYSQSLLEHAKGADVLFHEALNRPMVQLIHNNAGETGSPSLGNVTRDIPTYHSTPEDAARIARAANVKHLIYYHIIPPLPSTIFNKIFLGDARNYYDGPITVGEDGMLVFLPEYSDRIEVKKILR
jgi:ribonuclease Z